MAGIAAAYHVKRQPHSQQLIEQLLWSLRHRGPDGCAHWVSEGVFLTHTRLFVTEESTAENQPTLNSDKSLVLIFDGRIDNRKEIRDVLTNESYGPPPGPSDADLVLSSYRRWGENSAKRLRGDFAYVIWDVAQQRMICVRDPLGIKPLYYCLIGDLFICGSELKQALLHPQLSLIPNEGMVGEYLTGGFINAEETLYQNVWRLKPGHVLTIDSAGLTCRPYYDWTPRAQLRYARDQDYAEHFFELLKEAVNCRIRNPGSGVACQLSGGLDSSSVTSMAAFLWPSDRSNSLHAFSLISPEPQENELEYIADVTAKSNLSSSQVSPAPFDLAYCLEQVRFFRDIPNYPNDIACLSLNRAIHEAGYRVVLTGLGGDNFFFGRHQYYTEMIRKLCLRAVLKRFREDASLKEQNPYASSPWQKLMRFGLIPLAPVRMRRLSKHLLRRHNYPWWIPDAFARRIQLADRLYSGHQSDLASPPDLPIGKCSFLFELLDRMASTYQFETRHPLFDLSLIQFSMSLPDDQRRRGIWQRFVMRQAMSDLLPQSVYSRVTKASFNWTFEAAHSEINFAKLLHSARVAELGWIDADRALRIMSASTGRTNQPIRMFNIAALEWWYRQNFEGKNGELSKG